MDTRYGILDTCLISSIENRASRIALIALASLLTITGCSDTKNSETAVDYTYKVVKTYPHDPKAFTQGLVIENGVLYEGTGLPGRSTLRKVELETGNILKMHKLSPEFFGEGITIYRDNIIQLTYKEHVGFVYNKDTFELLRKFNYPAEGWGITHNGTHLITSDGTPTLYFLDPETFEQVSRIIVYDRNVPLWNLNELEYVESQIYANVWGTDRIARIEPKTGRVTGWIDMKGLLPRQDRTEYEDVLNGIAYDQKSGRLFVTGKFWPKLFEIKLIPVK